MCFKSVSAGAALVGWLTSEDVNLDQLDSLGLAKQAHDRLQARIHDDGLLVFEADATLVTEDYVTRKQRRAKEEQEAVGGLRDLALSMPHLRHAEAGSVPVRAILDEAIHKRRKELTQAMDTLGQEEMPECMMSAAKDVRSRLCAHYGVAECDGLQVL